MVRNYYRIQSKKVMKKKGLGLKPWFSTESVAPPLRAGLLKTRYLPGFSPTFAGF
jgi:hypothetical protein